MNDVEADLVAQYDKSPRYYSPLSVRTVQRLAEAVDATLTGPGLDIGCGDGRLARTAPGPLDGIDVSATRVAAARQAGGYRQLVVGDVYDLSEFAGPYATIYAVEVLEHLAEPELVVSSALDLLTAGGHLLATVPLQLPGRTHLQVFDSADDARHRLGADRGAEIACRRFRHAVLCWEG